MGKYSGQNDKIGGPAVEMERGRERERVGVGAEVRERQLR